MGNDGSLARKKHRAQTGAGHNDKSGKQLRTPQGWLRALLKLDAYRGPLHRAIESRFAVSAVSGREIHHTRCPLAVATPESSLRWRRWRSSRNQTACAGRPVGEARSTRRSSPPRDMDKCAPPRGRLRHRNRSSHSALHRRVTEHLETHVDLGASKWSAALVASHHPRWKDRTPHHRRPRGRWQPFPGLAALEQSLSENFPNG